MLWHTQTRVDSQREFTNAPTEFKLTIILFMFTKLLPAHSFGDLCMYPQGAATRCAECPGGSQVSRMEPVGACRSSLERTGVRHSLTTNQELMYLLISSDDVATSGWLAD